MKNPETFLVQTGLKSLGYDPGPIDGVPGPKTEKAKSQFISDQTKSTGDRFPQQTERWNAAVIRPEKAAEVRAIVKRILASRARYEAVAKASKVPWHVIAGLHNMESGGSFKHHLHEGSPLTARTKYVPKGRPVSGTPPFTWEESAIDALAYDKLANVDWSELDEALQAAERYNGLGHEKYHPLVPTPYLWAGTSIEKNGKYVADGRWDSNARSEQIGVSAIWKELQAQGAIQI